LPIEDEQALDAAIAGDPNLASRRCELDDVIQGLLDCVLPVAPPAHVRDAVLARIAPAPQVHVRRAQSARWNDAGGGLSRRVLGIDRQRGTVTTLVRVGPGGRMPEHHHRGVEEVFIISGDVRVMTVLLFLPQRPSSRSSTACKPGSDQQPKFQQSSSPKPVAERDDAVIA
jgi:hypothetical protein